MCHLSLPQQHSMQQELDKKLSILKFCRAVLQQERARMEFK